MTACGQLELPVVTFLHDRHTDALLKEKKDRKTCHLVEDDKLSLAFKRKEAMKPEEIKEMKGIAGVHVMAIEWEERVGKIVSGAGLLPRPVPSVGKGP